MHHPQSPMPPDIVVIVPVHNEAISLPEVIQGLERDSRIDSRSGFRFDILVVDDASTDDSRAAALALGALVLPLAVQLGAWGAAQAGLRFAERHGYQYAITMDGDGQHHGRDLPRLTAVMQSMPARADVVIGACPGRGGSLHRLAWRVFRHILGVPFKDLTSGFRMYNRDAIRLLASREATLLEYQDVGVLSMLRGAGLQVVETEVEMTPRRHGRSRVYGSAFAVAYYMCVSLILSVSKLKRQAATGNI